jgi:hypothetical protein
MKNKKNLNYLHIDMQLTPEQQAIVRELASDNRTESLAAAEAIAAVVNRPLLQVIEQAPVFANWFQVYGIGPNEAPKLPLSLFFDIKQRNYLHVFTQSMAGGTATNFVQGISDMYVGTYQFQGAASLDKSFIAAADMQAVAMTLERLAQEVLVKQNLNATNIIMASLANARIDGNASNNAVSNLEVIRARTPGVFGLQEFNDMKTKYRRIVSSWLGGTPLGIRASLTDLAISPEIMGQIRAISFQPQNTRPGSIGSNETSNTAIAAPESVREEIWKGGGLTSFFDTDLHEYNELGVNQQYNTVFGTYAGSTQYADITGAGSAVFAPTTEEILVGANQSMFDLVRVRQSNKNGEWAVAADDTFTNRSGKVGWYGSVNEGYLSLDGRAKLGLIC